MTSKQQFDRAIETANRSPPSDMIAKIDGAVTRFCATERILETYANGISKVAIVSANGEILATYHRKL